MITGKVTGKSMAGDVETVEIELFENGEPIDLTPDIPEPTPAGIGQVHHLNPTEQNFSGITAAASASTPDLIEFELVEAGIVHFLAAFNGRATHSIICSPFLDGSPLLDEAGVAFTGDQGSGNNNWMFLTTTSNGMIDFVAAGSGNAGPEVLAGSGAFLYLPAGEHSLELKWHSSSGANAYKSSVRMSALGNFVPTEF